jgi:hypothetical protein
MSAPRSARAYLYHRTNVTEVEVQWVKLSLFGFLRQQHRNPVLYPELFAA